jgi:hypothetical protein
MGLRPLSMLVGTWALLGRPILGTTPVLGLAPLGMASALVVTAAFTMAGGHAR